MSKNFPGRKRAQCSHGGNRRKVVKNPPLSGYSPQTAFRMAKRSTALQEAEALLRFNRPQRQVEPPSGFQTGQGRPILAIRKIGKAASCAAGTERFLRRKNHFSDRKSLPCSFCARKSAAFQQELVGWREGRIRKMLRFRPRRTATLLIENLRRGTRRGVVSPCSPQIVQKPSGKESCAKLLWPQQRKTVSIGDMASKTAYPRRKRW